MEKLFHQWLFIPVIVVETLWNLAFVVLSIVTLFWYAWEERCVRLRVWICGYVVHCVANVVILLMEYKKRRMRVELVLSLVSSSSSSENHGYHQVTPIRWETINKVFSYVWWPIGFIWMLYSYSSPGNAQLLLWLAMDVFFFVVTFLSLSLVGMACCLCLPCVIGFLCYIGSEGSASEAAIKILPEYRFEMSNDDADQPDERACRMIPMGPNGPDLSTVRFLQTEDADCCICLCDYEDGEQLLLLPCNHHFHSTCIRKWLRLKASCPVCKSLVAPKEQG
ncbi:E3 ubiquitin protein ligase RIE1-like [Bidens hawaiensis]|uniref:E3 ubiquitin protein ligase RIE1-like n=1 Tax=Bidens hawaiensis TaxID=980011 RepID=UPI00404ADF95